MAREQARLATQMKVGPPLDSNFTPPAGSLIIADVFTPSGTDPAHGEVVGKAARQNGFKGPVFTTEQPYTHAAGQAQSYAESVITNPKAGREDILKAISQRNAAMAGGLLDGQIEVVDRARESGARNSVLNLSRGTSKARVVSNLYSHAQRAWNPNSSEENKAYGDTVAGNYAKAYGLDLARLKSGDPDISGPERLKLQQNLVNHVDHTFTSSPVVKERREKFAEAVHNFEAGNNSVVVSAGNDADSAKFLIDDAHGGSVRVPPDYENSLLEIPETTSVGATRWSEGKDGLKESTAEYSSRGQGVDVYASGSVDLDGDNKGDEFGTSFSSPRVAATMAGLHKQFPKLSSSQIENLMRHRYTHNLNTSSGTIRVLDYETSANYLASQE